MNEIIDENGFKRLPLPVIISDVTAKFKAVFGENIDTDIGSSVFGQLIEVLSLTLDELLLLSEKLYYSRYPSTAEGNNLYRILELANMKPLQPAYSKGAITAYGVPGTVINQNSKIETNDAAKNLFCTVEEATIDLTGEIEINVQSVEKGSYLATSGSLSKIITPINGWFSCTNDNDIIIGRELETDDQIRYRFQNRKIPGLNNLDSLYSQIVDIDGVVNANIVENKTSEEDSNQLPPHTFCAVVDGGEEEEILKTIWANTVPGIDSYGALTGQVSDVQNTLRDVRYSRPEQQYIYIKVSLQANEKFPINGEEQVKNNIVKHGLIYQIGDRIAASSFYEGVTAVLGVDFFTLNIDLVTPVSNNGHIIYLGYNKKPIFLSENIDVDYI